jgi:hypothetical protein
MQDGICPSSNMNKYLLASPDRYGRFGHQTTSLLAALLLAHVTNTRLIKPRYMYFCDKWNAYSDYSRSVKVSSYIPSGLKLLYLEKETSDSYGNRKWDLSSKDELTDILNRLHLASDNSLIFLPFDQSPGLLLKLLNKEHVRKDVRRIFTFPDVLLQPTPPYACIHIRRGDCTRAAHPSWFVEDAFYINLIELLLAELPKVFKICLCTQGDISWLLKSPQVASSIVDKRVFIQTTDQLFINDSEVNDFVLMRNAVILFSASSSFSHLANVLGSHSVAFDVTRNLAHPLYGTELINPDAPFAQTIGIIKAALETIYM